MKHDTADFFIYDDHDLFNYEEITPEDKKFIVDIIDQTTINGNKQIFNENEDATTEIVDADADIKKGKWAGWD